MRLALVYLYEITHARVLNAAWALERLCGDGIVVHTVLATTKWGEVKPEVGAAREKELAKTYSVRMGRFEDTCVSAWGLVARVPAADAVNVSTVWALMS